MAKPSTVAISPRGIADVTLSLLRPSAKSVSIRSDSKTAGVPLRLPTMQSPTFQLRSLKGAGSGQLLPATSAWLSWHRCGRPSSRHIGATWQSARPRLRCRSDRNVPSPRSPCRRSASGRMSTLTAMEPRRRCPAWRSRCSSDTSLPNSQAQKPEAGFAVAADCLLTLPWLDDRCGSNAEVAGRAPNVR